MTTLQEEFLRTFHAAHPAVTVRAMAHGKTADGRSSYELLRDRVSACDRVLDLGCGDGLLLELLVARPAGSPSVLAGLDLSAEELALARRRPGLAAADLRPGRAQQLPFADGRFDGCLSHMALMLMGEVEQVAAEVRRVLAPGGTLAVVLGAGKRRAARRARAFCGWRARCSRRPPRRNGSRRSGTPGCAPARASTRSSARPDSPRRSGRPYGST
ncbi:class I SAM-dependent methyltransferase [Streptomyces platensis]|uniref:class I SAM-dependent methyltransferase n=1 Tax=Streptomyces platensis TaxID=58346 RepID=UPI0030E20BC9